MDCEQIRKEVVTWLGERAGRQWPVPLARHLEGCEACRVEVNALQEAWTLLGRWPETSPTPEIRSSLVLAVRRKLLRESLLTARGWVPAALAALVGVALSLALSLLVPYSLLVSLCRQALQISDPHPAAFLLAGVAYGLPLAAGVGLIRRRTPGSPVIGSFEASVLFLLFLAPYVIIQCRGFAPVFQAAFVSGLTSGAVGSSLAGLWLVRRGRFPQFRA